ncbi:MAG: patatin-like phospholipase family protein [Clostridiales bacterium]|nr:patatin-like phospholipase family protein [Clostridiales bacterium]
MKIGLVLEGGGAKGAYHVGAVKALYDNGYSFDGVAGTSIGAVNGAMIVQDDNYEVCLDMWTNIKISDVIDVENNEAARLFFSQKPQSQSMRFWIEKAIAIIKNFGVPTDKVIPFLKRYIDEDKIRNSGRDFAIVTFCISDKKPLELHLEDIPYGYLCDFVFASAYFPIFKMAKINGKYYLDGGVYDNLPINALIRKSKYDEIIAVRTGSKKMRPLVDSSVKLKIIQPNEWLGKVTEINPDKIKYNIKLGYYDALKMMRKLTGYKYYLQAEYYEINELLFSLSNDAISKIASLYKLKPNASKIDVISAIYRNCKKNKTLTNEQNFLHFLEKFALLLNLERFFIYSLKEFIGKAQELCYNTNILDNHDKNEKMIREHNLFNIIIKDLKTKGEA